jgi:RES domain-containing protein
MDVYRIAKTPYIRDLSGSGPRLYGGRWNPKGTGLIYTSENRALAALELFVHMSRTTIPPNLSLATIKIPDSASKREIAAKELPRNWRSFPAPPELAEIGESWIKLKSSLLLLVPSVIMPSELNVLINPAHPEIIGVRIIKVESYSFDKRMRQSE